MDSVDEDLSARILLKNVLHAEPSRSPVTRRASKAQASGSGPRYPPRQRRSVGGVLTPREAVRHSMKQKLRESTTKASLPPSKRRTVSSVVSKVHIPTPAAVSLLYHDEDLTPRHLLRGILRTEPETSLLIQDRPIRKELVLPSAESSLNSNRPSTGLSGLDLPDVTTMDVCNAVRALSRKRPRRSLNVTAFERHLEHGGDQEGVTSAVDLSALSSNSLNSVTLSLKTPFVNKRPEIRGLQRKVKHQQKIDVEEFDAAVQNREGGGHPDVCVGLQSGSEAAELGFTFHLSDTNAPDLTSDMNGITKLYAQPPPMCETFTFTQDKDTVTATQIQRDLDSVMEEREGQMEERTAGRERRGSLRPEGTASLTQEEDLGYFLTGEENALRSKTGVGGDREAAGTSQTGEEKDPAESQIGEEEAESQTAQDNDPAESQTGEEETESQTGEEETESQTAEEDAESQTAEEDDPAESQTGEEEIAESQTGEEETESQTGEEETESQTAEEDAESQTAEEDDPAESQTGEEEIAESQTGEEEIVESQTGEEEAGSQTGEEEAGSQTGEEAEGDLEDSEKQVSEHFSRRAFRSEGGAKLPVMMAEVRGYRSMGGTLHPTHPGGAGQVAEGDLSEFQSEPSASDRADLHTVTLGSVSPSPHTLGHEAEHGQHSKAEDGSGHVDEPEYHTTNRDSYPLHPQRQEEEGEEEEVEEEDENEIEELSMRTPAFVRERRKALPLDLLATPTVFRESQPSVSVTGVKPKAARKKLAASGSNAGLPKSYIMSVFKHFAKTKVSADVYPVLKKIMDRYFDRLADDLEAFAAHAKRKTIEVEDVELLLRRQGFVTEATPVNVLIEKYLPMESRNLLIPVATSGNQVIPKQKKR